MYPSRKSSIIFFFGFLIFILIHNTAKADFYVVAGGGKKVGIEITALPYTITQTGFYYITKDLSCAAGTHGITLGTSNVTIDLMGFSLVGPGGTGTGYAGIYAGSGVENIEIRNGNIRSFNGYGCALFSTNSKGCRIVNVKVSHNSSSGIILNGYSNVIKDCISFSNGYHGIFGGSGSTIIGNTCYSNDEHGIYGDKGSTISGNTCHENDEDGINTSYGCTIQGNSSSKNKDDGIAAGQGSSVIGNTCNLNTDHGIHLNGNSYVGQNTCYNNGTNMNTCITCSKGLNYAPASGSSAAPMEEGQD